MSKIETFIILLISINLFCITRGDYVFKEGYFETLPLIRPIPFRNEEKKIGFKELDNFNFGTNATFPMKYIYNDTYWKKNENGPIFFYTGNEGDVEMFAQNTGFMWDIAPGFGALVLFAEHRYYGASLPFGNESFSTPDKSGFLTSEQALADFAAFLVWFKEKNGAENCPVIAFGGSYGGMLTAWMRMKYPHIIQGGIAASAPVIQFIGETPCGTFGKIVTEDFKRESMECSESIRKSWEYINLMGSSDPGRKWLSKNWKLCTPLNNESDVLNLKNWLVDIYGNLAMVDYPYEASFLEPLPAYPIKAICEKLFDSTLPDKLLLKALFKAVNIYFNYTGSTECLDINLSAFASLGVMGWDYQACTEMIMPMCYDGVNDFFEKSDWNLTSYEASCLSKWKSNGRPHMIQLLYGGLKGISKSSNIIFSNGLLDPWSGGGVLKNLSDSVISIIIPEGAHHLDLRSSHPNDPESVIQARKIEKQFIRKWINEYYSERTVVYTLH